MIVLSYHIRGEPPGTAPPLMPERQFIHYHLSRRNTDEWKIVKESLQKETGRVIHNPIDGPDIVIDVPRPQPQNPEPCGNGIKPKRPPKPPRKTPLDPRLGRD